MNLNLSPQIMDRIRAQIARNTIEVGDCLEWTGCYRKSTPQMRVTVAPYVAQTMYVRRVAWILEHGTDPGTALITCRCGNSKCVRHLRRITQAEHGRRLADRENGSLRHRMANIAAGAKRAFFNAEQIAEIRASNETNIALAAKYGCHHSTISAYRTGKSRPPEMWGQLMFSGKS